MDAQTIIAQLFQNNLMQLATVADGKPWLCTICFVTDDENTVYWVSARTRRHSNEIMRNSAVTATVVSTGEQKQSLTIEGHAQQVDGKDLQRVHDLYCIKFGSKPIDGIKNALGSAEGPAYWMLKPSDIWLWDEINSKGNPKQHVPVHS